MNEKNRIGKLNIIEPWEFGTEKAITASVVDEYEGQYLISILEPLAIKGNPIRYLIGEMTGEEKSLDLFSNNAQGTLALNMVYSDEINEQNFKNHRISDFRGNFLLGEIKLV